MYTPPLHPTRCVPFRFRVPLVAFHPRSPASTHVSLSVPPFCYRYKDKVHRSFDKARNVLPPAGCAALFFSWGKTLPGISTTSTSPPFFSYLFFLFFTLFQNTLYHYLDLLPPSPFSLFSFRSLVISIRRKNSILLIDQNIRRYRYCVICSEFSLENLIQLGENKIYIIYFGYFFRWNRGTPCMCMDRY